MPRFKNMFVWHLRREWVRLVIISLVSALFMGLMVGISNSVRPSEMQDIYDKLPPAIHALIGMDVGLKLGMNHWLAIVTSHPIWLITIMVFPLSAGLRGIGGGILDGTLEPVLAQPISRTTYYVSLTAVLVIGSISALTGSFIGGVFVSNVVELPGEFNYSVFVPLLVSGLALSLSIGGITLLASAATSRRHVTWAVSTVVFLFFLRFLGDVWPAFSFASPVSIFYYHDPMSIVTDGADTGSVVMLLVVAVVCAVVGLFVFRKRQLTF